MWLYKDGQEVYCDKEQVQQFLDQGWEKEKPAEKEEDADDDSKDAAAAGKRILKKVTKE